MATTAISAQTFRIETEVFNGDSDTVQSQNITLFHDSLVYDFLGADPKKKPGDAPQLIVIWNRTAKEFIVLDVARKIKAQLGHEEVLRFNAELQASTKLRQKESFLFHPKFETSFDSSTEWLTLSSEQMTYQVKGDKISDTTVLQIYQDFATWYVMLNAVDPRKMPPFARLKLNAEIEKIGIIPTDVKLSFQPSQRTKRIEMRARHFTTWKLSDENEKQIQLAEKMKEDFEEVTHEDFYLHE